MSSSIEPPSNSTEVSREGKKIEATKKNTQKNNQ